MTATTMLLNVAAALAMLIPAPKQMTTGNGQFVLSKPYRVENTAGDIANNLYLQHLEQADNTMVNQVCIIRQEAMHAEAYGLHITPDTLLVTAGDREGFIHAGQTLQLLQLSGQALPACDIQDAPEFGWRGCMIDVSRHFYSLETLKRQIDIMASLKLNRLHLHLTDAAGWRLEIKRYPLLTQIAAWRTVSDWDKWWVEQDRRYSSEADGGYGGYYTQQQMRELVDYAWQRGITIVPEIELPGHSEEVLAVYPQLACMSDTGAVRYSYPHTPVTGYNAGDLCPSNAQTLEFLCHVLDEVMDVFTSTYIHIGGDEANMTAWKTCERCAAMMEQLGTEQVSDLQAHLISQVNQYLSSRGRRLIGWDEIIAEGNASTPVKTAMIWRNADYAQRAINNGYDVIMAPNSHCYVNRAQDGPRPGEYFNGSYLPLAQVMKFKPLAGLSEAQRGHVLGVQACLWTEHVDDQQSVEEHLYPRLFAMAQVGWGGQVTDSAQFRSRALVWCDALRSRGVAAFDLHNEVGDRPESLQSIQHLARGAQVTYLKRYNRYYPAAGELTLTDGKRGGWEHGDGRWQGFIGDSCVNVVIDLGQATAIHTVAMDFIQNAGPDIYLPAWMTIEVSTDGVHYRQLYRQSSPKDTRRGLSFHTWQWNGNDQARYVRVTATSHDHRSWIFTDEIVIK